MYCYACGEKLNDPELFCRKCGKESIVSLTEKDRSGSLRQVGYFALGAATFALVFLVIISLLTALFPTLGSPLLTLLIMFTLGLAASGSAAVLYARGRSARTKGVAEVADSPQQVAELETAEPLALPSERFGRVPESVVDRTTDKLHIRRS
jgi:hypothetical protein